MDWSAHEKIPIKLTINDQIYALSVESRLTVLDLLREELRMTGTKKGCDHGQCGACTILIDGKRRNSCLTLAVTIDGSSLTTIEGLSNNGKLHPLQEAFIQHDAFQCGYCTPGQLCSAVGLISEGRAKTREDVEELMSGNICRCAAYRQITDAVMSCLGTEGKA